MSRASHDQQVDAPRPWRPRFGIGALMLLTLVCCVSASAAYYSVHGLQKPRDTGPPWRLIFILFTLAAPMFLAIVVSAFRSLLRWVNRRQ